MSMFINIGKVVLFFLFLSVCLIAFPPNLQAAESSEINFTGKWQLDADKIEDMVRFNERRLSEKEIEVKKDEIKNNLRTMTLYIKSLENKRFEFLVMDNENRDSEIYEVESRNKDIITFSAVNDRGDVVIIQVIDENHIKMQSHRDKIVMYFKKK